MTFWIATSVLASLGWLATLRKWSQAVEMVKSVTEGLRESDAMLSIYRRENRRLRRRLDAALPRTHGSKVAR